MQISPLTPLDASSYRTLMLHAYEHAADAFTSTAQERELEPDSWWVKRIGDPSSITTAFGAYHEGKLIGTVALEFSAKPKTRHKALVIGMFVHESCRGMGAGRALMDATISAATARPEVLLLTLTVTEGNAPAIKLYESCGFVQFGLEPMAILTPAGYKAKVHMWRSLGRQQEDPVACVFR